MWMICLGVCRFRLELGRPVWSLKNIQEIQETNSIFWHCRIFRNWIIKFWSENLYSLYLSFVRTYGYWIHYRDMM